MSQPSKEEILKFLSVLYDLENFEAQTRQVRGYGAFREADLPIHEFTVVTAWLKSLAV